LRLRPAAVAGHISVSVAKRNFVDHTVKGLLPITAHLKKIAIVWRCSGKEPLPV
jgi:hypothetical protein